MTNRVDLRDLIERHRALDLEVDSNREGFLSDWNGDHPFVTQFLGGFPAETKKPSEIKSRYIYYEQEPEILDAVVRIHEKFDGLKLARTNVIAGPGSSSILVAFCIWLLQHGYTEVFYVPPLYYTFHYFLRSLGIQLRPITGKLLFDRQASLNLPDRRCVLLLSDPIWFAGKRLLPVHVEMIAEWQVRHESTIFVDGSFQYMQWQDGRHEHTSKLDLDRTFRLICPTKSLAIHNYRFAYLLHPAALHDEFLFLYENLIGGVSEFDFLFAKRALSVLINDEGNRPLTNYLKYIFENLQERRLIAGDVSPDCGYFAFVKPLFSMKDIILMREEMFEARGFQGYARINLLIAKRLLDL